MVVSEQLKTARKRAGLTQAEVARRAGTSQPTVAAYEAGRRIPRADTLDRLLAACGERAELGAGRPRRTAVPGRGPRGPRGRLLRRRRDSVLAAARAHGLGRVRVFGSVARGEDTPGSDIDLLVDARASAGPILLAVAGLSEELSRELGVHVDVVTEELLRPSVRAEAVREAVPL